MKTVACTAALALLAGLASAGGEKVAWDKPEDARAKAAATGKPILYYFLQTEQKTENGKTTGGGSC